MATPLPARTSKNDALIMATPSNLLTARQRQYADTYGLTLRAPSTQGAPAAAPNTGVAPNAPGGLSYVGTAQPVTQSPVAHAVNQPVPGQEEYTGLGTPSIPSPGLPNEGMTGRTDTNIANGLNPNGTPVTPENNYYAPYETPNFDNLATSDPGYLLAIQRLNENISNARAEANTGKVSLKTKLQDILRGYDRGQQDDTKSHIERFGGHGMLYSGRQVEDLGSLNQDYADRRTRSQRDELEAEGSLDAQVNKLERSNVLDSQQALYDTVNRLKGNAGNYQPTMPPGFEGITIPQLQMIPGTNQYQSDPARAALLRRMLGSQ